MTNKIIEELFDRFENSSICEMEYEADGCRLFLKKNSGQSAPVRDTFIANNQDTANNVSVAEEKKTSISEDLMQIKAPLVGTFYRASAPGADPFIRLGSKVNKGDVVGMIEAMKFMNEIQAPCDGEVVDIAAENAEFVAYDQVLITIKRD